MWRRFRFFEKEERQGGSLDVFQRCTCATSGRGQVFLGLVDGSVQALERGSKTNVLFQAHKQEVDWMSSVDGNGLLVTAGREEGHVGSTSFKIWDLDQSSTAAGPLLVQTVKGFLNKTNGNNVTSYFVAVDPQQKSRIKKHPNLLACFGMSNGDVYVLWGDIVREKHQKFVLSTKEDLPGGSMSDISGFGIVPNTSILFVVTKSQTLVYDLATRSKLQTLDDEGCDRNCVCSTDKGQLMVGRKEAIYMYEMEGRGPCFAFPGDRLLLKWWQGYLITVDRVEESKKLAVSNTLYETEEHQRTDIKVYDLQRKLVVCNLKLDNEVLDIVFVWDGMLIIQRSGCLYVREKNMASKLDILFQKDLYVIALNMVPDDASHGELRSDVHRRYGDHLYKKSDYSGAMEQYLETIGFLEPSYVIRKFLDAQRINSLALYLEKLHEKGLGGSDHTTLLLNCYTRLKDVSKLDSFIAAATSLEEDGGYLGQTSNRSDVDVDTAISVLRSADYFEHALFLAKQAHKHDWYFRILLDDLKKYDEGIDYIVQLDPGKKKSSLLKHGKAILDHAPARTTALLMELCTLTRTGDEPLARATEFLHIFIEHPQELLVFLEFVVNTLPGGEDEILLNTMLLELYLRKDLASVQVACEDAPQVQASPQDRSGEFGELREKAMALLEKSWPEGIDEPQLDASKALMLCQASGFSQGLIFLYERMEQYREVFGVFMADHDYYGMISTCKRYAVNGVGAQQYWLDILDYLVNKECVEGKDVGNEVKEVLDCIHDDSKLPPMLVLQTLSKNRHLTMDAVQSYISKGMELQSQRIKATCQESLRLEEETKQMEKEVTSLRSKPILFQNNKCSACMNPLDLPSVHFFCMHSYHQRCLEEAESECPLCAPMAHNIWEIQAALSRQAMDPKSSERFFQRLEGSSDGFSVVAEQFSRGFFCPASTEELG